MTDKQDIMWDVLTGMDADTAVRAITNYHGMQLLDDGFYEFLQEEGLIEAEDEQEEDDE